MRNCGETGKVEICGPGAVGAIQRRSRSGCVGHTSDEHTRVNWGSLYGIGRTDERNGWLNPSQFSLSAAPQIQTIRVKISINQFAGRILVVLLVPGFRLSA